MIKKDVLFLGKKNDDFTEKALNHAKLLFDNVTICLGSWGDDLPEKAICWEGDLIVSYLSRWVVPEYILKKSRDLSINFHPATPEYPGIGCNNFALYEGANEYGATCHHMTSKVDTGNIIKVSRFKVYPGDCVETLLERTYSHQLCLFYDIIGLIYSGIQLPESCESWGRKPFSRSEFNRLFEITPDMKSDEIQRRVRALRYKEFKPYVRIKGYEFELKNE